MIFTIIYDVLQHYDDGWCSPEGWNSLLMSLLAENNGGKRALRKEKKLNARFKYEKFSQCLVASSHVPILKHKACDSETALCSAVLFVRIYFVLP